MSILGVVKSVSPALEFLGMARSFSPALELLCTPPAAPDSMVPVLILKVGRYALHDTHGLGIIRSLGRLGVPVYGVVEDGFTTAVASRYTAGTFIWDNRGLDAPGLLEGLAAIGERLNRPAVLIPTDDAGAVFVAEHAAALRRWFIFPQQPPGLPRTVANKKELYFLCKRMGVPCPKAVFPRSIDDVREFVESAAFPVVVKTAERRAETGRTVWIARSPEEVYAIYRSAEGWRGTTLLFQEYIPPAYGEDWFYHGYRNTESGCCIGFTGRKFRSHPAFAGPTTLGRAVVNESLRQQAEALLRALSYSGITDLDYRLDKRDGQYKLLDFNPRIGAQFRLFEDASGIDVARALYLDLTGTPVGACRPVEGRTFVVEPYDLLASLEHLRRGRLTLRRWLRSFKGRRELAWFNRDDPLPFLVLCVRLLLRVFQRALRVTPTLANAHPVPRFVRGLWHREARGRGEPAV